MEAICFSLSSKATFRAFSASWLALCRIWDSDSWNSSFDFQVELTLCILEFLLLLDKIGSSLLCVSKLVVSFLELLLKVSNFV
jgi:hypothetical protein